jgi:hypothetical protein
LEKKLAQEITIDNRETLEAELLAAKELLKQYENSIIKLRKDNSKTFMISACLVFVIFLIFGLYSMVSNNKLY